jgi:hypothetical protein
LLCHRQICYFCRRFFPENRTAKVHKFQVPRTVIYDNKQWQKYEKNKLSTRIMGNHGRQRIGIHDVLLQALFEETCLQELLH